MYTKKILKFFAVIMCLVTISLVAIPNFSYTYAADKTISGSTKAQKTIIVTTGSKAKGGNYLKFTFTQGTIKRTNLWTKKDSTRKHYGWYQFRVFDAKTGKFLWWTYCYDKKSFTLKLSPNKTYKIIILPTNGLLFDELELGFIYDYHGWKTHAKWSITKQNGIKSIKQ